MEHKKRKKEYVFPPSKDKILANKFDPLIEEQLGRKAENKFFGFKEKLKEAIRNGLFKEIVGHYLKITEIEEKKEILRSIIEVIGEDKEIARKLVEHNKKLLEIIDEKWFVDMLKYVEQDKVEKAILNLSEIKDPYLRKIVYWYIKENLESLGMRREIAKAYDGEISATIYLETKDMLEIGERIELLNKCYEIRDENIRKKIKMEIIDIYQFFMNGGNFEIKEYFSEYYLKGNSVEKQTIDLIKFYSSYDREEYEEALLYFIEGCENIKGSIMEKHIPFLTAALLKVVEKDPFSESIIKVFSYMEERNWKYETLSKFIEIMQGLEVYLRLDDYQKQEKDILEKRLEKKLKESKFVNKYKERMLSKVKQIIEDKKPEFIKNVLLYWLNGAYYREEALKIYREYYEE